MKGPKESGLDSKMIFWPGGWHCWEIIIHAFFAFSMLVSVMGSKVGVALTESQILHSSRKPEVQLLKRI